MMWENECLINSFTLFLSSDLMTGSELHSDLHSERFTANITYKDEQSWSEFIHSSCVSSYGLHL